MRPKTMWIAAALFLLAACTVTPAPIAPTSRDTTEDLSAIRPTVYPTSTPESAAPAVSDLLVYQAWDHGPLPELIVRQTDGKEVRRIALPKAAELITSIIPLRGNYAALFQTSDERWFIVRAALGEVQELDIPAKALNSLYVSRSLQGSGKRWAFLQDRSDRYVYLIDIETGAVVDLTASGLSARFFKDVWLSPQEDYLAVYAGELGVWLVPTADPVQARRLGSSTSTSFGGFSTDGKRVIYGEVNRAKPSQFVVEDVSGSNKRIITAEREFQGMLPVVGTDQVVMYQQGQAVWFDVAQDKVLARVPYSRTDALRDFWVSPDHNTLFVGKIDQASSAYTHWSIDAATEISHPLRELDGYSFLDSLLQVQSAPYALVAKYDFAVHPAVASLAAFNVATQKLFPFEAIKPQEMTAWPKQLIYGRPQRFALFEQVTDTGQLQLLLLDNSNGQSRIIAESSMANGAVSISDRWVATNVYNRKTEQLEVFIINTETAQSMPVGTGGALAWVVP